MIAMGKQHPGWTAAVEQGTRSIGKITAARGHKQNSQQVSSAIRGSGMEGRKWKLIWV